jgi:hypothetical protein
MFDREVQRRVKAAEQQVAFDGIDAVALNGLQPPACGARALGESARTQRTAAAVAALG